MDSCPSHDAVGGLFFDFEAIRTESSDRESHCMPSSRVDGVARHAVEAGEGRAMIA